MSDLICKVITCCVWSCESKSNQRIWL